MRELEPGVRYNAEYIDPETMKRYELGEARGDSQGEWRGPTLPHMHDWLLLMTAA